ncbi:unnamed protein product [Cylicocyclus nassatus]|uniref:Schlafen AlbA-2 domain-containing protein n=1 Tax=Cylicocyclus nassatus TaxID=53992 RepID=A0AA36GL93_CYLNA|nr:unnamed protein product [Cylicocyclus nassatus]
MEKFKMHMKHSLMEIPAASQSYDHGRPVRQIQPTSKTISAFLNTEGGTIYIGIDDDAFIHGMQLTDPMKDHFILSLNHCISQFTPPAPPELVQVQFLEIEESDSDEHAEDVTPVPPAIADGDATNGEDDDSEAEFQRLVTKIRPRNHLIGQNPCPCESLDLVPKLYLVVIKVHKSPDGTIYQNEERLAYRRRNGWNQMMTVNYVNTFMHAHRINEYEEEDEPSELVR